MTTLKSYVFMITRLLHNIGDLDHVNYNTREEIAACEDLLTFDGVYRNVYENRDILKGKQVILFVMGDYVGKDNSFDRGMPLEQLCTWKEIEELVKELGCEVGWHTWSHRNLKKLSDDEVRKEVTPPFPMDSFAYPHGRYDKRVIRIVKEVGFARAYGAGKYCGGTHFEIKRRYL